jgi:hypothetical protein
MLRRPIPLRLQLDMVRVCIDLHELLRADIVRHRGRKGIGREGEEQRVRHTVIVKNSMEFEKEMTNALPGMLLAYLRVCEESLMNSCRSSDTVTHRLISTPPVAASNDFPTSNSPVANSSAKSMLLSGVTSSTADFLSWMTHEYHSG